MTNPVILGKSRKWCGFPLPSSWCFFYGDTISSVGVIHRPSFFFLSSVIWGSFSLVSENSVVHHAHCLHRGIRCSWHGGQLGDRSCLRCMPSSTHRNECGLYLIVLYGMLMTHESPE